MAEVWLKLYFCDRIIVYFFQEMFCWCDCVLAGIDATQHVKSAANVYCNSPPFWRKNSSFQTMVRFLQGICSTQLQGSCLWTREEWFLMFLLWFLADLPTRINWIIFFHLLLMGRILCGLWSLDGIADWQAHPAAWGHQYRGGLR